MQSQLKILFVDDHIGLRDAIINMLSQNSQFFIVAASNKQEALDEMTKCPEIQTVVLDLNLNGSNGLEILSDLRKINSQISVLIYSMYNDPIHIEQSLGANIQGYLSKDSSIEDLEKAILSVSSGNLFFNKTAKETMNILLTGKKISNNYLSSSESEVSKVYSLYQTLTQKEKDVFYYLSQKKDVDEIAKTLGKSEKTVINQKSIIYSKMNIRDRLELLEDAKLLGLII